MPTPASRLRESKRAKLARRTAIVFSAMGAFSAVIFYLGWRDNKAISIVPQMTFATFSLVGLAIVLIFRQMKAEFSSAISISLITLSFLSTWQNNQAMAKIDLHYEPFIGYKIVALMIAVVGPMYPWIWASFALVFACAVLPALQYFQFPVEARLYMLSPEPWPTILYVTVAVAMLAYRIRMHKLEEQLMHVFVETTTDHRLAKAYLAIRDMFNSPLQSLALIPALLRTNTPETEKIAGYVEEAVGRLEALSQTLYSFNQREDWHRDSTSFDALESIDKETRL